ncbi:MAG: cation:proton antiporter [Thermoguttaceae bacterium]
MDPILNESTLISQLTIKLLIILVAGFIAGAICKRLQMPMVIGYLIAGVLIGQNFLGLLGSSHTAGPTPKSVYVDSASSGSAGSDSANSDSVHSKSADSGQSDRVRKSATPEQEVQSGQSEQGTVADLTLTGNESVTTTGLGTEQGLIVADEDGSNTDDSKAAKDNGEGVNIVVQLNDVASDTTTEPNKIEVVISPDTLEIQAEQSGIIQDRIIENLAHFGAILLLFSIGINFSPSELKRIWKLFLIGGTIQMITVPLIICVFFGLLGWSLKIGFFLGSVAAISSTVLVFKSLEDCGRTETAYGLRAIAILLFQDIAVVPLLLLIPLLASVSADVYATSLNILLLCGKSVVFISFVMLIRAAFLRWGLPLMMKLRSVELTVLLTLALIVGVSAVGVMLELSAAIGALAAGVILSENRLTHQITAITVPFRESFSAIFFVSLGALFDYHILFQSPLPTLFSLLGILTVKTTAAALAFRVLRLNWITSFAMGLGLSQLGELSFILLSQGLSYQLFDQETYQRMLFIALTSIILTPLFLRVALRWTQTHGVEETASDHKLRWVDSDQETRRAAVIGIGPIGSRIVSFLELSGFEVCLLDMNPVNLHHYAQLGFMTISGDATDPNVLELLMRGQCQLVVVSVPDDRIAIEVTETVRELDESLTLLVRCRYIANVPPIQKLGATRVICEESEAGGGIIRALEQIL